MEWKLIEMQVVFDNGVDRTCRIPSRTADEQDIAWLLMPAYEIQAADHICDHPGEYPATAAAGYAVYEITDILDDSEDIASAWNAGDILGTLRVVNGVDHVISVRLTVESAA